MKSPKPHSSRSSSHLQTSSLLQNFLEQHSGDSVTFGELLHEFGNRAFGPTLLICALPEALPLPIAGVSAIIGIPLIIVSIQLLLGFPSPRLPQWIASRSIKRRDFEKIVQQILRYLEKFERVIRPRWGFATTQLVERLLGFLFLMLAIVIALPIPFGNMLPAIAIVVISLGMIEGDGLVIVVGTIAACIILVLMTGAIITFFSWVTTFLRSQLTRIL